MDDFKEARERVRARGITSKKEWAAWVKGGNHLVAGWQQDRPNVVARSASTDQEAVSLFVDEEAMVAAQGFAIPPEELIAKTKDFLATGLADPDAMGPILAEDFAFIGPVVGPLGKEQLLTALRGFDVLEGLPDLVANYHHIRVCPFEPGRVWFSTYAVGTHTGKLAGQIEPTGIVVESPPQTNSLKWDEEGKVVKYTVGVVNDRQLGNTGGLGGIFGILYAVGSPLPFPEAQPWKMSKRYRFFQWLGSLRRS